MTENYGKSEVIYPVDYNPVGLLLGVCGPPGLGEERVEGGPIHPHKVSRCPHKGLSLLIVPAIQLVAGFWIGQISKYKYSNIALISINEMMSNSNLFLSAGGSWGSRRSLWLRVS